MRQGGRMVETQLQLITLLSEKRDLLEKMLPYLEEERRCIVELDMARLSAVAEQKSELLDMLQETSKRSRLLMQQLACEMGMPEAQSLSPLLSELEEPRQEELRGLQGAILASGAAFEQLLRSNGDLLKGALLTVDRSLEFFGRVLNNSTTYGEAGRMVGGANRSRFLSGEV